MKEFYCQYCGKKVGLNSKCCPNCKKSFESVLCPKCLYSGEDYEFSNGCPNCGYLKEGRVTSERKPQRGLSVRRFTILFSILATIITLFSYLLVK